MGCMRTNFYSKESIILDISIVFDLIMYKYDSLDQEEVSDWKYCPVIRKCKYSGRNKIIRWITFINDT